jgi:hypothetical protein
MNIRVNIDTKFTWLLCFRNCSARGLFIKFLHFSNYYFLYNLFHKIVVVNLEEREHLEAVDVDGRITLKWMLKKWDMNQ